MEDLVRRAAATQALHLSFTTAGMREATWLLVLAAAVVALLGGAVVAELLTCSRYDLHKIPLAPNSVPLLGHLLLYWRHKDFTQWFLKFHDTTKEPVLRVSVPYHRLIIVADPGMAAAILARTGEDRIPRKVPEYSAFDAATGLYGHHSILTEQNEEMWLAVRKALSPAYTPAANKQNYAAVLKAYGDVARRISAAIKKQQVPVKPRVSVMDPDLVDEATARAAGSGDDVCVAAAQAWADLAVDHHLLGAAIQTQIEGLFAMKQHSIDVLQAAHDIETAISIVHHHPAQPWLPLLHFWAPWASRDGRRLREARTRLARECYEPIYEHVMTCASASDLSLTACLRRLVDPVTNAAPGRERLLAEIGNQIMAPETAAHTIAWVLYCVATHPDTEAKLLAELKQAGLPCNGNLEAVVAVLGCSFDPLKNLPFLGSVINEAMRLYPVGASASPRLTEKPTRVGPYRIPAGVTVFPSLFVINNYSGSWGDDARQFKPDRWLDDPNAATDPASGAPRFLPFSAGPKNCIGLALGQVAVRSAVALLLSTFKFKVAARMGSHEDVLARSMLALTLKLEGGMWLSATYRAPKTV